MKKTIHILVASVMIATFITLNTFAMPYNPDDFTSINEASELLAPNIRQDKATAQTVTRGDFFASADLMIRNDGDGNIGALAVAFTRYPVDEAYITVYLDRWDANAERWREVKGYEAEFYAKDYPDGLTTPRVDITFKNNEKGYYYRLRSVFAVIYNNEFEGFSPVTDGILLE